MTLDEAVTDRKLPNTTEFAPGYGVDLFDLLRLAAEGLEPAVFKEAIRVKYFADSCPTYSDENQRRVQQGKRAQNVIGGMRAYKLLEADRGVISLTDVGRSILEASSAQAGLEILGRHILLELDGLAVLMAIRNLEAQGLSPKQEEKKELVRQLRLMGFSTSHGMMSQSRMLDWLALAGVVDPDTRHVSEATVARLTGVTLGQVEDWLELTYAQQAWLKTFKRMSLGSQVPVQFKAKQVTDEAELEHGDVLGRSDQHTNRIYRPLEEAGWVVRTGVSGGRGSKSGSVEPTQKLLSAGFEALTGYPEPLVPQEVLSRLNTPLPEVLEELESDNKYVKGVALELLTARLAIDLALVPQFRKRNAATLGNELDVVAEGAHLHYSRWLFQCKNTPHSPVRLEVLAREIGMGVLLEAAVVVIVTTGSFTREVPRNVDSLTKRSPLQVVLLDGDDLKAYSQRGFEMLSSKFHEKALLTMRAKLRALDDSGVSAGQTD